MNVYAQNRFAFEGNNMSRLNVYDIYINYLAKIEQLKTSCLALVFGVSHVEVSEVPFRDCKYPLREKYSCPVATYLGTIEAR